MLLVNILLSLVAGLARQLLAAGAAEANAVGVFLAGVQVARCVAVGAGAGF